MPELPEIETVKRTLTPFLPGRRIEEVRVLRPEVVAYPASAEFIVGLTKATVATLSRRGKYLCIHLADGATLIAHLRMTGRFLYTPADKPLKPHTHVVFRLDNGQELRFSDTRRFGRLWLIAPGEADTVSGIHKLGPEPLDAVCDAQYYQGRLSSRRISIKQGLLDQSVVAGLGNIYVDEALYMAAIDPRRPAGSLSGDEWLALAEAIPLVLLSAIANNGTTFSDYLDGEGNKGRNLPHLQAYGRAGQPCLKCGAIMERIVIGGRGSTYCPHCQR